MHLASVYLAYARALNLLLPSLFQLFPGNSDRHSFGIYFFVQFAIAGHQKKFRIWRVSFHQLEACYPLRPL